MYEELIKICGIENIEFQPQIIIIPPFKDNIGKKYVNVSYKPDFLIKYNGLDIYVEAKGLKTDVYKLRMKFLKHVHPDILLLEVNQKRKKKETKFDVHIDNMGEKLEEFSKIWKKD